MKYDVFLLTFDTTQTSRETLLEIIDDVDDILNWYAFLPGALCLISELSTADLSKTIRSHLPELRFLLVRLEKGQRQGWLPKSAWRFINEARPAGSVNTAAE
jgi:hypothetical protein